MHSTGPRAVVCRDYWYDVIYIASENALVHLSNPSHGLCGYGARLRGGEGLAVWKPSVHLSDLIVPHLEPWPHDGLESLRLLVRVLAKRAARAKYKKVVRTVQFHAFSRLTAVNHDLRAVGCLALSTHA